TEEGNALSEDQQWQKVRLVTSIAADVTPELARATIASVSVLGALHATPAVKAALADRMR
ncbi:MAG: hypothetical protein E7B62_37450, partial [Bradyrhizobium sp.]|nr:hypothetical protein [Bradyrhizobium sp.]